MADVIGDSFATGGSNSSESHDPSGRWREAETQSEATDHQADHQPRPHPARTLISQHRRKVAAWLPLCLSHLDSELKLQQQMYTCVFLLIWGQTMPPPLSPKMT